ncbi:hypothetical protein C8J57DRAFT_1247668 [Mycena rebaudengoi]|nr:hypothetical protein C8J57DRAFT_1247668 [Mycena rebaudengoi]
MTNGQDAKGPKLSKGVMSPAVSVVGLERSGGCVQEGKAAYMKLVGAAVLFPGGVGVTSRDRRRARNSLVGQSRVVLYWKEVLWGRLNRRGYHTEVSCSSSWGSAVGGAGAVGGILRKEWEGAAGDRESRPRKQFFACRRFWRESAEQPNCGQTAEYCYFWKGISGISQIWGRGKVPLCLYIEGSIGYEDGREFGSSTVNMSLVGTLGMMSEVISPEVLQLECCEGRTYNAHDRKTDAASARCGSASCTDSKGLILTVAPRPLFHAPSSALLWVINHAAYILPPF